MKNFLREKWLQFCNFMRPSPPDRACLRDKAIAVAGRVTTAEDRQISQVSCPVCLKVLRLKGDTDLRMTLAIHLSLFHPDDVDLQWNIMQNKNQSIIHLPSLIIGVGIMAGFGALLAISARNRNQLSSVKMRN